MSTISVIGAEREDGAVDYIYCNWGGQLWGNGSKLMRHYGSADKVDELIALGGISSLGRDIGDRVPFTSALNNPETLEAQCLAYRRDRGDRSSETRRVADRRAFVKAGVTHVAKNCYLFTGERWEYCTIVRTYLLPQIGEFSPLDFVLCTAPTHLDEIRRFLEWSAERPGPVPRGYGIKEYAQLMRPSVGSVLHVRGLRNVLHQWRETLAADPDHCRRPASELLGMLPVPDDARPEEGNHEDAGREAAPLSEPAAA